MIKLENTKVVGWEPSIRGMRNPKNSWDRSDSDFGIGSGRESCDVCPYEGKPTCLALHNDCVSIGPNDHKLMMTLAKGGPVHAKYRRMIHVYVDITAPLYWWKEFDTYRFGVEKNSCSTMHKIHDKEFTLEDFSCEHLWYVDQSIEDYLDDNAGKPHWGVQNPMHVLNTLVGTLNYYREEYIKTKDKKSWWQMIQLLPSSYNQKRTVELSYEALANIYEFRRFHKLDEWREMCKWIETLPYSEIITQPILEQSKKVDVEEIFALIEKVKEDNPYIKTELLSEFEDRLREKVK